MCLEQDATSGATVRKNQDAQQSAPRSRYKVSTESVQDGRLHEHKRSPLPLSWQPEAAYFSSTQRRRAQRR